MNVYNENMYNWTLQYFVSPFNAANLWLPLSNSAGSEPEAP